MRSNTRDLTYGLYLPSQRGPTTQLPLLPAPLNCGQWPCVSTSELRWGPLTAPNTWAQSRTQRAIQVCTAIENLQKGTRMIPASLSNWQVFLEVFIGQWILPCLKVKVCFRSRAWPFPDLSSGLQSISICACPPREYSPTLPWRKTHQPSLGYSATCSSLCEQWSCITRTWLQTLPELASQHLPSSSWNPGEEHA